MNDLSVPTRLQSDAATRVAALFAVQRRAFAADPYPAADARRAKLKALKHQIRRYQDLLAQAMSDDFGYRATSESKLIDLLGVMLEANHAIRHLRRWMRPSRRAPELLLWPNRLQVRYQPKGVVGVVVPWNLPVYLAVGPLIAAIAAGNRVMIKMPERTPATNALLARVLAEVFSEDEVAVVGEELLDTGVFTALPFDHLVFTGSTIVGRIVMRSAADHLTPVTLELGGKSPAVVTRNYSLADAARRIAHGKVVNCGQLCVAPDYALVPREGVEAFVDAARARFAGWFGSRVAARQDYTSLVDDRHHRRLLELLEDARAQGARIIACADYDAARDGRNMPLHIVTGCTPAMRLMQEEIFGPVLPVIAYDTLDDAIDQINRGPRPLALYCFSDDAADQALLLRRTHSGGVTINDWGWHAFNYDAPFGGIGDSGTGSYHGVEGFRELSHARTVFRRHRFFPTELFHPPYGNLAQRLSLKFFLGRADPTLTPKR